MIMINQAKTNTVIKLRCGRPKYIYSCTFSSVFLGTCWDLPVGRAVTPGSLGSAGQSVPPKSSRCQGSQEGAGLRACILPATMPGKGLCSHSEPSLGALLLGGWSRGDCYMLNLGTEMVLLSWRKGEDRMSQVLLLFS